LAVVGIEDGTLVRVEGGAAPRWFTDGERVPI
jgi:hypothetical protein